MKRRMLEILNPEKQLKHTINELIQLRAQESCAQRSSYLLY